MNKNRHKQEEERGRERGEEKSNVEKMCLSVLTLLSTTIKLYVSVGCVYVFGVATSPPSATGWAAHTITQSNVFAAVGVDG